MKNDFTTLYIDLQGAELIEEGLRLLHTSYVDRGIMTLEKDEVITLWILKLDNCITTLRISARKMSEEKKTKEYSQIRVNRKFANTLEMGLELLLNKHQTEGTITGDLEIGILKWVQKLRDCNSVQSQSKIVRAR